VNVRLLSATHRDLEAAVAQEKYRQDLYFRLKVVTIRLPPLRERKEDIPLLCNHFNKELSQRHGKKVSGIDDGVRKVMARYDWPGNVRELRNVLESMIVQDTDGVLGMDDLPEGDSLRRVPAPDAKQSGPGTLAGRPLSEVERYYIERTLEMTEGNREEAARRLGIGERTLYRVIQEWKVQDKIKEALTAAAGDLDEAAKSLGMKPQSLQRKMKKWGMDV
jgi:two-component system response regulator HydG